MAYVLFIMTLVKLTFHLFEKLYSLSMTLGLKNFLSLNMVYSVKGKEREGGEKGEWGEEALATSSKELKF